MHKSTTANISKQASTPALHMPLTDNQVLDKAAEILANNYLNKEVFCSSEKTKQFVSCKLANYEREIFSVMMLDNQHRLIEWNEMFFGTIDAAAVYPREVVKVVLKVNAAAVILAHNHPSGIAEPSQADIAITKKLVDALALIDVKVLDHLIVSDSVISFAEKGLM